MCWPNVPKLTPKKGEWHKVCIAVEYLWSYQHRYWKIRARCSTLTPPWALMIKLQTFLCFCHWEQTATFSLLDVSALTAKFYCRDSVTHCWAPPRLPVLRLHQQHSENTVDAIRDFGLFMVVFWLKIFLNWKNRHCRGALIKQLAWC